MEGIPGGLGTLIEKTILRFQKAIPYSSNQFPITVIDAKIYIEPIALQCQTVYIWCEKGQDSEFHAVEMQSIDHLLLCRRV